ncbi:MAG: plastocyanin/azurin family copper-binding protein [Mycobacteriales bacterium]|nr:hypothetical protein [Frankia sp.]
MRHAAAPAVSRRERSRVALGGMLAGLAVGPVFAVAFATPIAHAQAPKAANVDATAALKFEPAQTTVAVGGTVTWTFTGGGFHTVYSGDGSNPAAPTPENGVTLKGTLDDAHKTYTFTFTKAGTYRFFCQPHVSAGMKGEIVVGAAGTGASPNASIANPGNNPGTVGTGAAGNDAGEPSTSPSASASAKNPVLEDIEAREASEKGPISGFLALTAGSVVALVVLFALVALSTRTRSAPTR